MIDTTPLHSFDPQGFIDAYRAFYRAWSDDDPDQNVKVSVVRRFGDEEKSDNHLSTAVLAVPARRPARPSRRL